MKRRHFIGYLLLLILIPGVFLISFSLFGGRAYLFISLAVALLSCVPFFLSFERKKANAPRMAILAVMVALSVLGRFLFAAVPHFKPVAAIVVITGMYLGAEAGFLCGALSALLSGFLFGQGPWTPFQMVTWGVIGFLAALLSAPLIRSRLLLGVYGVFAGFLFSAMMDVYTVLSIDGVFSFPRYFAAFLTALPVTAVYCVSNVLFLLILARPIGEKLMRIRQKYGV